MLCLCKAAKTKYFKLSKYTLKAYYFITFCYVLSPQNDLVNNIQYSRHRHRLVLSSAIPCTVHSQIASHSVTPTGLCHFQS